MVATSLSRAACRLARLALTRRAAEEGSATASTATAAAACRRRLAWAPATLAPIAGSSSARFSALTSPSTSNSSAMASRVTTPTGVYCPRGAASTPARRSSRSRWPPSPSCSITPTRSTYSTQACSANGGQVSGQLAEARGLGDGSAAARARWHVSSRGNVHPNKADCRHTRANTTTTHLRMRALAAAGAQPQFALPWHDRGLLVAPCRQAGSPQHLQRSQSQIHKCLCSRDVARACE